jgi:hypothetical protein
MSFIDSLSVPYFNNLFLYIFGLSLSYFFWKGHKHAVHFISGVFFAKAANLTELHSRGNSTSASYLRGSGLKSRFRFRIRPEVFLILNCSSRVKSVMCYK